MNRPKNLKKNSIAFSLYFILFFIAGNGLIEIYHRTAQEKHEVNLQQAAEVNEAINSLLLAFHDMDIGFRGYYIVPNEQLLSPFKIGEQNYHNNIEELEEEMAEWGVRNENLVVQELVY